MYRINDKNIIIKCRYTYAYTFFCYDVIIILSSVCVCVQVVNRLKPPNINIIYAAAILKGSILSILRCTDY